jgi:glycosyltransferase involved in cell wall biosynthesis
MIAFVQPFGLYGLGGGPKILRALLQTNHAPVLSVNTGLRGGPTSSETQEIHVPKRPPLGRLDRTRFYSRLGVVDGMYRPLFKKQLRRVLLANQVKVLHIVPHDYDIVAAYELATELNIPYFLSVHDDLEITALAHPLMGQMLKAMKKAWLGAKGIFVISEQMGKEYSRRYGTREYQVVTDGLMSVAPAPQARPSGSLRVYFMGLFHHGYRANMRALLDALKIVRDQRPGRDISLTFRSGQVLCPVTNDDVPIKALGFAPDDRDLDADLLSADLLYQPLSFDERLGNFGKFSMSTKMVTYLGSGLPILYHGPQDAAACTLLQRHHAAAICSTLDPKLIAGKLIEATHDREKIVSNALTLARTHFMLSDQQQRFWQPIAAAL